MNSHKNARLTYQGRLLLIERISVMGLTMAAQAAGGLQTISAELAAAQGRVWALGYDVECWRRRRIDPPAQFYFGASR